MVDRYKKKTNLICNCFLINRTSTLFYKTKSKKICQRIWIFVKIWGKVLGTATKTGLDAAKTASKKVVYKKVEVTGELILNKSVQKIVEPKPVSDENSRNAAEILFHQRKSKKY